MSPLDDGHFAGRGALEIVGRLQPGELACAFPPADGLRGASTTISDLSRHGVGPACRLFVRSKADAVKLIVATNYERACGWGHGNPARRRFEALGVVVNADGRKGTLNERGELVMAHGVLVSPRPSTRPATMREGAEFFRHRAGVHADLCAYYDRNQFTGD